MKKIAIFVIMAMLAGGFQSQVQAQNNGMDGFILGAGGGALIGQAIGRNTESTLIGTAVGSMLGYVIGNERDKNGTVQVQSRSYDRAYSYPPRKQVRQYYTETYLPPERHQERICRESEVLATIDGRPEVIFGTVCLENGKWVMASDDDVVINQTIIMEDDDRRGHGNKTAYYRKHHKKRYQKDYKNVRHNRYRNAQMERDWIYNRSGW